MSSFSGKNAVRQTLVLLALLLVIGGSIAWTAYWLTKNRATSPKPDIWLYCTECSQVYQPENRLGGEHPRACDKCREKAAWFAMQCSDCGEVFPLSPETDENGKVIRPKPLCPNCRSGNSEMYHLSGKTSLGKGAEE